MKYKKYYQNEPRFNGVFARNNLPKKIKDGAYIINLDEHADVGTYWIALFCNKNKIIYFDNFGEFPDRTSNKNMISNIFRIQANASVMCGYFCIGFIDFMVAGKKLSDFTNLFTPYDLKK